MRVVKTLFTLLTFCLLSFGFGFCISPDYTYNAIEKSFYGGFQNQAYGYDSIFCVDVSSFDGNILTVDFMNGRNWNGLYINHNGYDLNTYPYNFCFFVPSDIPGIVGAINGNFSNITFKAFQFIIGGGGGGSSNNCVGAVCEINFYDTYNQSTSQYTYNIVDGGYQSINVSYNSRYDGFQTINGDFAISPLQDTIECPARLSNCQSSLDYYTGEYVSCSSSLSSCQSDLENYQYYYQTCSGERLDYINDLLECQDDYSTLSGNYSTLNNNYTTCQNELNTCMGGVVNTGDLQWSAIFINQIQHIGKPVIRINIPEEINRDYSNTGDSFNLDINGYNQDTEYIDGIITAQNYKPTKEDFTKLVGLFGNYGGLLLACLLVIIIFSLIRKIFK